MIKPNFHLKVPEELDKRIAERAKAEYRTKASVLKQIISEALENDRPKQSS